MKTFYRMLGVLLVAGTLQTAVLAQPANQTLDDPTVQVVVGHDNPPPPPKAENPGPAPTDSKYWIGGNWIWKPGNSWAWRPGVWVDRPNPNSHWIGGHWAWRPYGHTWIPGHWGW